MALILPNIFSSNANRAYIWQCARSITRLVMALCLLMASTMAVHAQQENGGPVVLALSGSAVIENPDDPDRDGIEVTSGMRLRGNENLVNEAGSSTQLLLPNGAVLLLGSDARFDFTPGADGRSGQVTVSDGDFRFASRVGDDQPRQITFGDTVVEVSDGEVAGKWNSTQNAKAGEIMLIDGAAAVTMAAQRFALTRPGFGVQVAPDGALRPPRPVPVERVQAVLRDLLGFEKDAVAEFNAVAQRQRDTNSATTVAGGGQATPATGQNIDVDQFLAREVLQRPSLVADSLALDEGGATARQAALRGRFDLGRLAARQIRVGDEYFQQFPGSSSATSSTLVNRINRSLVAMGSVSSPLSEALSFASERRVAGISATDTRGLPITFSLLTNPGNRFRVAADGGLYLLSGTSLNFETEPSITARVQARNSAGETLAKDVVLQVTNANDAPSAVTLSRSSIPDALTPHFIDRTTSNLLGATTDFNDGSWTGPKPVNGVNTTESSADGSTYYFGSEGTVNGVTIFPFLRKTVTATLPTLTAQEVAAGRSFEYGFDWNSPSDSCAGGSGSCKDSYAVTPEYWQEQTSSSATPEPGARTVTHEKILLSSVTLSTSESLMLNINAQNRNSASSDSAGRPSLSNPFYRFKYKNAQPFVIGTLGATDEDSGDTHSFSLASDPSNLFEVRGKLLVLKRSDSLDASTTPYYDLGIQVQDQAGATETLTLRVNVTDAGGTSEVIRESVSATQGSALSMDVNFAATGAVVSAASLPTWMTLQDLGNGLARLTGTPSQSGSADFTVISTKDGVQTGARYRLAAAENCTGAYCAQFASSIDTQNLLAASDLTSADFADWSTYHNTFSSGTGRYSQMGSLTSSNGTWSGSVAAEIDFGTRVATIQSSGTFSNYTDGNGATTSGSWSAAFTSQTFGDGGSGCGVTPGACTFTAPHSGAVGAGIELKTCTGSSGTCATSNHASVAIAPEVTIQAKTVSAGGGDATHAMLANSSLRDRNATTSSTVQANSNGAQLMVAQ